MSHSKAMIKALNKKATTFKRAPTWRHKQSVRYNLIKNSKQVEIWQHHRREEMPLDRDLNRFDMLGLREYLCQNEKLVTFITRGFVVTHKSRGDKKQKLTT